MKILVTGAAGFIGMHTSIKLASEAHDVIGIDNINSYYDVNLKYGRLKNLGINKDEILYNKRVTGINNFSFVELDLQDAGNLMALFSVHRFDIVINLAAQAGVRYSITNPRDYIESNIVGFFNILETCRTFPVRHLIYASSSSVYGNTTEIPFKINQNTDQPISLYAATKKSNELMAFTYAHLYKIPISGLRFFTVYGPWGRPDMAYFSFTKNIYESKPIQLFNAGDLKRDFTYIDDVVGAINRLLIATPDDGHEAAHKVYNIGNNRPESITYFLSVLEGLIGQKAIIEEKPKQAGDVDITYADCSELNALINFEPRTPISLGLKFFVAWYNEYYKV
ncbi:MAG: NAD-dependent epimerase/dehydratase family protein [Ferruginibacter sp.]